MNESKDVLIEFFAILQREGISLQREGVNDIALTPAMAQKAITVLRSSRTAVTGGEVWEKKGERFVPTYDIWDVEESDYTNYDEYVQASLNIAERQIQRYINSKDEVFISLGI